MISYELTIILRVGDSLEALKEKTKEILLKHGAVIALDEPWGHRKMAYQIDGEAEGFYQFFNLEASPDSIQKIIADFRLISDILRYLFVKLKVQKPA